MSQITAISPDIFNPVKEALQRASDEAGPATTETLNELFLFIANGEVSASAGAHGPSAVIAEYLGHIKSYATPAGIEACLQLQAALAKLSIPAAAPMSSLPRQRLAFLSADDFARLEAIIGSKEPKMRALAQDFMQFIKADGAIAAGEHPKLAELLDRFVDKSPAETFKSHRGEFQAMREALDPEDRRQRKSVLVHPIAAGLGGAVAALVQAPMAAVAGLVSGLAEGGRFITRNIETWRRDQQEKAQANAESAVLGAESAIARMDDPASASTPVQAADAMRSAGVTLLRLGKTYEARRGAMDFDEQEALRRVEAFQSRLRNAVDEFAAKHGSNPLWKESIDKLREIAESISKALKALLAKVFRPEKGVGAPTPA
jgi:hypothetical protein